MMARRGRKRNTGQRQPNGQPKRIVATKEPTMQTVLNQPHRRGNSDQRCASVLGRFCLRAGLRMELYDAGEEYAAVVRRWRSAKGVPAGYANHSGRGSDPSDEAVANWKSRMIEMERAMNSEGFQALMTVRQLTLDGNDIGMEREGQAVYGLMALAVHLGFIRHDTRPFALAA